MKHFNIDLLFPLKFEKKKIEISHKENYRYMNMAKHLKKKQKVRNLLFKRNKMKRHNKNDYIEAIYIIPQASSHP